MYESIPLELRALNQWVCWRYEKVSGRVTKVPYSPNGLHRVSIHDPGTWGKFSEAVQGAASCAMNGIGLVLTEVDPYTGIDIDDKQSNPASDSERAAHRKILDAFQSYTERSVGERWTDDAGQERGGYHIIIRGKIKGGRDHRHVGVYSSSRYLTFSGDVVRNAPIAECQPLLDKLVEEMPSGGISADLEMVSSHLSDAELHDMAISAANGSKYDALCKGQWQELGYPSQSEADLALMSMFAFYSRDNEQCRRLFRYSALGRREKATRDSKHLDRMLKVIRARQPAQVDFDALAQDVQKWADEAGQAAGAAGAGSAGDSSEARAVASTRGHAHARVESAAEAAVHQYTLPPGIVGDVARYIHSSAVRPSQEVSLLYAIGFFAGIVGRNYNVSGTGLNVYLLLVAATGIGKEDGPKAVERLIAAMRPLTPVADEFLGPSAFASGQALIRVLDQKPCFVSLLGEFGLTLQALNDPRAPAALVLLRKVLLDLYSKSGWNNVLRETAYSDKEKNTKTIHAPAVTWVGDTTPETLYENMSVSDVADGLLPRLHILEANGARAKRNRNAGHMPDDALVKKLCDVVAIVFNMTNNGTAASVQFAPNALEVLDAFDEQCDALINDADSAGQRQLWNRAHLKALKLAGVIAVGCNPSAPAVTADVARWAVEFTRAGTLAILARFERGDVGTGNAKQTSDMRKLVKDFYRMTPAVAELSYRVRADMREAGVMPYTYFYKRACQLASFYNDRAGAVAAIKRTLQTLIEIGELLPVSESQAMEKFGTKVALYYRPTAQKN